MMRKFSTHRAFLIITCWGLPAMFSTVVFVWIYQRGLVNLLVDAQSHWIHSFLMIGSITPGITQLGFWPPLLHVILLPAVALLPFFLLKDIGAYVTLLPMLLVSMYYFYALLRLCGVSKGLSLLGPALILLHPFVQYFTSSAMAEIPLIFTVFGCAYYAAKWRKTSSMKHLSLFGIFVSLTVLSRYEGALIAPFSALFVLFDRIEKRVTFAQMKAELIIFIFMASIGPVLVMAYSYVYAGSLFGFLNLGADRVLSPTPFVSRDTPVTLGLVLSRIKTFYYGSLFIHGRYFVWAFPFAAVFVLLRRKWDEILLLLILLSPAIFVILMMIDGRSRITIAGMGSSQFANTRYALTWVGALYFPFILGIDFFPARKMIGKLFRASLSAALIVTAAVWCYQVVVQNDFSIIRKDETVSGTLEENFFPEYDGGRVLMTRDHNVREVYYSVIPTDMFVFETNYLYFPQAIREPWLFVRWVVIRPESSRSLASQHLKDMLALESNPAFQMFYELVVSRGPHRIYRLREDVLRATSQKLGYDPMKIPSLNTKIPWYPTRVYEEMKR